MGSGDLLKDGDGDSLDGQKARTSRSGWLCCRSSQEDLEEEEEALHTLHRRKHQLSHAWSVCHVQIAGLSAKLIAVRMRGETQKVRLQGLREETEQLAAFVQAEHFAKTSNVVRSATLHDLRSRVRSLEERHRESTEGPRAWREGHARHLVTLHTERARLSEHYRGRRRLNKCLKDDSRALREAMTALLQLGDRQTCALASVRSQNERLVADVAQAELEVRRLQEQYWEDGVPFSGFQLDRREVERLRRDAPRLERQLQDLQKELQNAERSTRLAFAEVEVAKAFAPVYMDAEGSAPDNLLPRDRGLERTLSSAALSSSSSLSRSPAPDPPPGSDPLRSAAAPASNAGSALAELADAAMGSPGLREGAMRCLRAAGEAQDMASLELRKLGLRHQLRSASPAAATPVTASALRSAPSSPPPLRTLPTQDLDEGSPGSDATEGVRRELAFQQDDAFGSTLPGGTYARARSEVDALGLSSGSAETVLIHHEQMDQQRLLQEIRKRRQSLLESERQEQERLRAQINLQQEERLRAEQAKQEELRAAIAARARLRPAEDGFGTSDPGELLLRGERARQEQLRAQIAAVKLAPQDGLGTSEPGELLLRGERARQEQLRAQIAAAKVAPQAMLEKERYEQERLRAEIARWTGGSAALRLAQQA